MQAYLSTLENVIFEGKSLVVERSEENSTGYKNVFLKDSDKKGPMYYAKVKLDGEQETRTIPGSYQRTPVAAAAALEYYRTGYLGPPQPTKKRKPRRSAEVSELPSLISARTVLCAAHALRLSLCTQEIERDAEAQAAARLERKEQKALARAQTASQRKEKKRRRVATPVARLQPVAVHWDEYACPITPLPPVPVALAAERS